MEDQEAVGPPVPVADLKAMWRCDVETVALHLNARKARWKNGSISAGFVLFISICPYPISSGSKVACCLRRSWELPRFHLLKRNNLLEPMPKRNPPNSELAVTNGCVQKAPKPPGSIRREPRLQTEGPWAPRWSGYEAHLLEAAWWWWWIWVCIIYYNNIWHYIYTYIYIYI